jgi:hypothetical protein
MVCSSLALVLAHGQPSLGIDKEFLAAVGTKTAVVIGQARHVASGVAQVSVSTSGGRAVFVTTQLPASRPGRVLPTPHTVPSVPWLVAADLASASVWRVRPAGKRSEPQLVWAPDGKWAYAIITDFDGQRDEVWECVALNTEARVARTVATGAQGSSAVAAFGAAGQPGLPILVQDWSGQGSPVRIGVPKADRTLAWFDWTLQYDLHDLEWALNAAGHWTAFVRGTDARYVFDPTKPEAVQVRGEVVLAAKPDRAPGIVARLRPHALTNQGSTASTQGLWVETDSDPPERVLVATDVLEHFVSDDWTWIAYLRGDGLYVHDVEIVDAETIRQARDAAVRAAALKRAKQVGTAVMLFGADHDGRAPTRAEFAEAILPYVKSESLLSGFVYLLDGQNLDSMENLAETELGYVPVKGGRAVVYADGHAKIVYDGKKP